MCIGIDHCSRKNCIEQERCLYPTEKAKKKVKIRQCKIHKKFCTNERACEILGQCIFEHPLIRKDGDALKQLYSKTGFNQIVKIAERLMPSLNKPGKKHKQTK